MGKAFNISTSRLSTYNSCGTLIKVINDFESSNDVISCEWKPSEDLPKGLYMLNFNDGGAVHLASKLIKIWTKLY